MPAEQVLFGRSVATADPVREIVGKISALTASRSMSDDKIGNLAISTESVDSTEGQLLNQTFNNMETQIQAIVKDLGIAVESHNVTAATLAGIYATNPRALLSSKLRHSATGSMMVNASVVDGMMDRGNLALEAYDDRENRNAQLYSIVYNLLASRQDDFGEVFFPTLPVNSNEVGITVSMRLFYVYRDFKRSVTGSLANYGRVSLVRAYADAEILQNELTRAIPVVRSGGGADDNTHQFVDATDVPAWSTTVGGVTINTSAIKVDTRVDLLGLSQTNELLNSGIMGPSDTLDTYIKLETVFIKATDGTDTDVIAVDVSNLPDATFTYAPQGNNRRMLLAMDTDSVVLGTTTTKVGGGALSYLTELSSRNARVQLSISGSVVLDKGDCTINRGSLSLSVLRSGTGASVTGTVFDDLAIKLESAEIIGATVVAYRANSNIRERGQLLDSQIELRTIQVPYRSPVSVIMPAMSTNAVDNGVLQNLLTTTGVRISNEAVTAVLRARATMSAYKGVMGTNGDLPATGFLGDSYLKLAYFEENVALPTTVNNVKSHEKLKDIRAALVEKVRYYANEMYRVSEYKAASSVLTGNVGFKPTVIIGTDSVLYNYLTSDGDLRILGDSFDVRIVSTTDSRMKNKIVISFGVFDASRNTSVNVLNSGNMLYSPELTVQMPVSRNGQTSNEMIVVPRFYHAWHLPVMTMLNVTGMPEVTGKVAIDFHEVP